MAIYRTQGDANFKNYGQSAIDQVSPLEWADELETSRIDEPSWSARYEYESSILLSIIRNNQYKKILELGSGPGLLGQFILKEESGLNYSYVDKLTAKNIFEKRKFKGSKFFIKDLMHFFDISELDNDYDLIIANDFLEHIANPSSIMNQARKITKQSASFFISVPNWRMNHEFIYRGLFDYDNFLYFCKIHGWNPASIAGSPLRCNSSPRESSEQTLPEDLISSWNWYIHTEKEHHNEK